MEILMDYHLVFIVIAFVLLLITILFLFIEPIYGKVIAGMLLAGINYLICLINSFAFFRIGLVGYTGEGVSIVTSSSVMEVFFVIFFLLHFLNIALIFYASLLLMRKPWEVDLPKNMQENY